jgi:hypothetical protein
MTYDDNRRGAILSTLVALRLYVQQNESEDVQRRRKVRELLRGLNVDPRCGELMEGKTNIIPRRNPV